MNRHARVSHPFPTTQFPTPSLSPPLPSAMTLLLLSAGTGSLLAAPPAFLAAVATRIPALLASISTTASSSQQHPPLKPKKTSVDVFKPLPPRQMSAEAKELHDRCGLFERRGGVGAV